MKNRQTENQNFRQLEKSFLESGEETEEIELVAKDQAKANAGVLQSGGLWGIHREIAMSFEASDHALAENF